MTDQGIQLVLASEDDAPKIALIMTRAFEVGDRAYPIVWREAGPGMHEKVVIDAIFTPVQKPGRFTYLAVKSTGEAVGFVTWTEPSAKVAEPKADGAESTEGPPPALPGANMELFFAKLNATREAYLRQADVERDMNLDLCFTEPSHQRQGIAGMMLNAVTKKADELGRKCWCTSTPQAVSTYERFGWTVVERHEIDLEKWEEGAGSYTRALMVRLPVTGSS